MSNVVKENSTNQANKKALSDRCGVNDTLALIGKRWLMAVLYEISLGNNQFRMLEKNIPEISAHMLGTRVNDLIKQGLIIKKEIEHTVPLQIVYLVTVKGEELLALMNALYQWNRNWEHSK